MIIKIVNAPWGLSVEDGNKAENGRHSYRMTYAQMLLSFMLVAVWMPGEQSQEGQYQWLKNFVRLWSKFPNNGLLRTLETISKSTLERYLEKVNNSTLILLDGTETTFGTYLEDNMEAARFSFASMPRYNTSDNADWMQKALDIILAGQPVYTAVPVTESIISFVPSRPVEKAFQSPSNKMFNWMKRIFNRENA